MFIALIREGGIGYYEPVWQIKKNIHIQCGSPTGLKVREYILASFDPDRFEKALSQGEEDCLAAVCMGRKATEALTGFPLKMGSVASHHFGVGSGGRKLMVLTTLGMPDFEGSVEENANRINLVKVHLHRLAVAAGLIDRV